jgi:tRNA threonylcarbamoyladenosine biosynthesis protein TsaE
MIKSEEVFITNSFRETQGLGEEFVEGISGQGRALSKRKKGALAIGLYGDLGSGKTTFVQGMAYGLGIKRRIISPTFVIVRQYNIPHYPSSDPTWRGSREVNNSSRQARTIHFYHIDLYRIEKEKHIVGLGIEEIMNDPQNIVAIEWAEKMEGFLPKERWDIHFEYSGRDRRKIGINRVK